MTAEPPPRTTSPTNDDLETAAALIYTSKSLNRCGILAHIILNFYDFGFHIRAKFNGVQLRAIRLLAKFSLRISDERLRNLRQDGILKFHPFAKDRLKPDGGILPI
ncbi:hypothetical protein [Campylobacter sp.]|uniref:hypothetical protein n=1 Tax=Campylobacter sp. TaxID=205 RepID=UPI0027B8C5FC|nr:hypothetical protein [Campylobacter sp.]